MPERLRRKGAAMGPKTKAHYEAGARTATTMNLRKKAHYRARATIIKAMSHPTRLFIVEELSRGERCVCELTQMVGDDVSTISKHLSVLKNAGIVTDKKRGAQVFYTLRVPCILNFFSCVNSVLKTKAL
jgi:ArsR family transcriptional regulator